MANEKHWFRRLVAVGTATAMVAALGAWLTFMTTASPASATSAAASPYFAGVVATPQGNAEESAGVTFVVPTVTCQQKQNTLIFLQDLVLQQSENAESELFMDCGGGAPCYSVSPIIDCGPQNECGTSCNAFSVSPGDSVSLSELAVDLQSGPGPYIEIGAADDTNGNSFSCIFNEPLTIPGPVYTGVCTAGDGAGSVPAHSPPPPPEGGCQSDKGPGFTATSFTHLTVDQELVPAPRVYNKYRYRAVGSTLQPIEQVQTLAHKKGFEVSFLHH